MVLLLLLLLLSTRHTVEMASTLKIHKKHYIAYGRACNLAFDYILLLKQSKLVGGFNPFQTKNSQIGAFPQVGMKLKKIFETTT